MRWQVVAGLLAVGLFMVVPASATVIDFSIDPNLSSDWTMHPFYEGGVPGGSTTATWNAGHEDLDLASTEDELAVMLSKNGTTRSDTDSVMLTLKDYNQSSNTGWVGAELALSAVQSPGIFDDNAIYRFVVYTGDATPQYVLKGANNLVLDVLNVASFPSTIKLDIVRDGADYVFKINGDEIFRDATYASTSLPYYFIGWGASGPGAANTLTVRADDFGAVPEPGTLTFLASGLIGLLAYVWRKRR